MVALHQLRQDSSESTKAYSARVKGLAKNCNLVKTCTRDGCSEKVFFVQETCYHVVMAGLASDELKEKGLTQAMLGVVTDLPSLLNYTSAEESSRKRNPVNEIANVSHRRSVKILGKTCTGCGLPLHGVNNRFRSKDCKAFNKACTNCNKKHHFSSVCRSH